MNTMAQSTAQRQATYRKKIGGTHQRVEIMLDHTVYQKLQTLVEQSLFSTRIDYMTALIEKEYRSLSGNALLADHSASPAVPGTTPGDSAAQTVIEIWRGAKRCQARTARGARCRITHHLSIIRCRAGKTRYEVVACKQHRDRFTLHDSLVQ